jgi:hypothetical protein
MFNFGIRHKKSGEEKLRDLCGIHWGSAYKGEMKNDHNERTNRKLKDQPFYHRGSKGKMRNY